MAKLRRGRSHLLRDLVLYVAISLLIAGIFLAMAIGGVSDITFHRWIVLILASLCIFGFWLERNRERLRHRNFLLETVLFLTVHLIAWSLVLWHLKTVTLRVGWLFISILVEVNFFFQLQKLFDKFDHKKHQI